MSTDLNNHPDTGSWARSLGVTDRTRTELEHTVSWLSGERDTPISEAACRVNQHDLVLLYQLIQHLSLKPKEESEHRLLKSLHNALRQIGRLQSEDVQCEASHQAYVIESQDDRQQAFKQTRSKLSEIAVKARDQQDLLGALFPGEQEDPVARGASERLSRDAAWAHACLHELR